MSLLNRSNQTLNINTFKSGVGINITNVSNTSESTCNVKISSNTSQKTSLADDDILLLEDSGGNVKYITGAHLESHIDTNFWTFSTPNIYPKLTSENLLVGTTSNSDTRKLLVNGTSQFQGAIYSKGAVGEPGYINIYDIDKSHHTSLYPTENINANVYLPNISDTLLGKITQDTLQNKTFNNFNNTINKFTGNSSAEITTPSSTGTLALTTAIPNLLTAENFGTGLSRTDPDTLNVGTGGNDSGVGTTTNIDGYNINIGELVATGGGNSGSLGANEITIQATQYYSGNPKIHITAQSASGVVETGAEVNITSKKVGSGTETAKITMVADTEIIMNTGFKINSSGAITAVGSKITNGLIDCGIADNKIVEIDSSTVADNDYAKFTANGLEGRSYAEVVSDIGSSITTVGTIATGTWNGTKIGVAYGGTNLASYTSGDLLYASGSTTLAKLAIGSANKFLMSNGSNPVWSLGYSFTYPLNISGTSVNLGNLSGWGSNNQILATNGSDTIEYRTLTEGTNITIAHTSSTITISGATTYWENANTIGVLDIQPTSSVNDIDLDSINLLTIPKTVNVIPSGSLATGKVIQYDSGLGGGNGSMIFGDNGSSASANWDTGIYAKQFIELKCGTQTMVKYNNTPAGVSSATFTVDNFNITIDSNNSYSNLTIGNCDPLVFFNKASSGTTHSHIILKRDASQSDFVVVKTNDSDELLIHHENVGDTFVVGKLWEFGNKGVKFHFDNTYCYMWCPEDTGGGRSDAGSLMRFHKNGSVMFFNTTSTYSSGNTNYFSFAKSNDQEARITMNGIAQISDEWTDNSDPSDRRIKYDIKDYENATEVINKIKIKSFMKYRIKNFNNDAEGKMLPFADRLGEAKYSIGVIAQELFDIPELSFMVRQSDFNDITPAYIHDWKPIISLLVKSNQEQQEEINTLKTELENIKSILLKNNIS